MLGIQININKIIFQEEDGSSYRCTVWNRQRN